MKEIKEIYAYRQMIFSLVRKDLRGRYKGSILGFLWTFINPLLQLVVYTFVFSTIMRTNIKDYYLFLFVALIPWIFFSACLTSGSSSVLIYKETIKKIYFPRHTLPIAFVASCFVNMLFSFLVVFAVLIVSGKGINLTALCALPIVMFIEFMLCLGTALLTSSLTVYLRDLEYILGIIAMAWQFLTPIMYTSDMVPDKPKIIPFLWNLNPMTPVINAYRDILYYKTFPHLDTLRAATILGVFVMVLGYIVFNKLQRGFAEEF